MRRQSKSTACRETDLASIYQTNLDEFFMVRVGSLMMQMNSKEKIYENKTKMSSEEQVAAILDRDARA